MFVLQFFYVLPPVNVFLSYCSENGGIILRVMLKNINGRYTDNHICKLFSLLY